MAEDCLFCKIIAGEIPSDMVYEDDRVVVFKDINPAAPVHDLIVPRKHIATLNDVTDDDGNLIGHMLKVAADIAKDKGIAEPGYRTLFNVNAQGCQMVYHLHLHLIGGRQLGHLG